MQVLVYEFFSAGGAWHEDAASPVSSLLQEGAAMVAAVAADLSRLEGVHPVVMRDRRLGENGTSEPGEVIWVDGPDDEKQWFDRLVAKADWTILVAPEWDGLLHTRACRCLELGGQLLGPGPELIALGADKNVWESFLLRHDLPAVSGYALRRAAPLPRGFSYPAILKPRFGAGSTGIQWIENEQADPRWELSFEEFRLESYWPGVPVSVGILMGPGGSLVLPGCRQLLSEDQAFQYLGGETPLPEPLAHRASTLGKRVADVLPAGVGYVGMDLVLGPEPEGDRVIELNPRLTTSYVGLSALAKSNLAEGMLSVAQGKPWTCCFERQVIQFDTAGQCVSERLLADTVVGKGAER